MSMSSTTSPLTITSASSRLLVSLNVGGTCYTTTWGTISKEPSLLSAVLGKSFVAMGSQTLGENSSKLSPLKEPQNDHIFQLEDGTIFIDRDGILFRYILDYLRHGKLYLPEDFTEFARLKEESKFYQLPSLTKILTKTPIPQHFPPNLQLNRYRAVNGRNGASNVPEAMEGSGYITVGYRGTFAFGRDGQADVKFRKLNRILICGKARLCREVFGESLNESRDPDRGGEERYTSRLYLKHNSLEKAFDQLSEKNFHMVASCASGAGGGAISGPSSMTAAGSTDLNLPRTVHDSEEHRWDHYNEFVFYRSFSL